MCIILCDHTAIIRACIGFWGEMRCAPHALCLPEESDRRTDIKRMCGAVEGVGGVHFGLHLFCNVICIKRCVCVCLNYQRERYPLR